MKANIKQERADAKGKKRAKAPRDPKNDKAIAFRQKQKRKSVTRS